MNDDIKKKIDNFTSKTALKTNGLSDSRIKKADYDKTLIGFVSAKIVPENPKDDNDYRWRIQTNGVAYDIKPSSCNITSVGQRVRLFVPNHKMKDKYAEIIPDNVKCTNIDISDNELIFSYDDDTTETVQVTRDNSNRITSFSIGDSTVNVKWGN